MCGDGNNVEQKLITVGPMHSRSCAIQAVAGLDYLRQ